MSVLDGLPPAAGLPAQVLADSDVGKGSPIGLLVVLLLIVAVYFLYRSMNRHLRRVPPEFGQPKRPADQQPADQQPAEEHRPGGDRLGEQPPAERPLDRPPPERPADQPPGEAGS